MKREVILKLIKEHLKNSKQWSDDSIHFRMQCRYMAEGLIQLLEIEDCGSTGGYDRANPLVNKTLDRLYNRYLTLKKK